VSLPTQREATIKQCLQMLDSQVFTKLTNMGVTLFFAVLEFEHKAYTLSYYASPTFVLGFSR
jgi:hypothetical protein